MFGVQAAAALECAAVEWEFQEIPVLMQEDVFA
jgi:hypothetical protein